MILQRGTQKPSWSGVALICLLWLVMFTTLFVSVAGVVDWLDYLYIISYIKLAVTPIKYLPQVS
jgi:cystinosin